jgi:hypothetical protein
VAFVSGEVEPIGVIATGTIVRGTPHASSDLDLYIIHAASFRRRIQRLFDAVPAEIFINPPQAIRGYFESEYQEGRPITAHMLATGFIIWSNDSVVDDLRAEARQWLERVRPLGAGEAVSARYTAATMLEDGFDLIEHDAAGATLIMSRAVAAMLEVYCRMGGRNVPRPKDLLATVREIDPTLGAAADAYFSATMLERRRDLALTVADRAIGARGFFEWDSGPADVAPPAGSGWSTEKTVDNPDAAP